MIRRVSQAALLLLATGSLASCHLYFDEGDGGESPPNAGESTDPAPTDPGSQPDPETPECVPDELFGGTHPQCNGFSTIADCDGYICAWCSGLCVSEELSVLPLCQDFNLADSCQPSSCQGEVVCDLAVPECPLASTPVIVAGCYTGACIAKADCPDGAPFACSELNADEEACIAHLDCAPVYRGVNCTSDSGAPCTGNAEDCACESFAFDACE